MWDVMIQFNSGQHVGHSQLDREVSIPIEMEGDCWWKVWNVGSHPQAGSSKWHSAYSPHSSCTKCSRNQGTFAQPMPFVTMCTILSCLDALLCWDDTTNYSQVSEFRKLQSLIQYNKFGKEWVILYKGCGVWSDSPPHSWTLVHKSHKQQTKQSYCRATGKNGTSEQ